MASIALTRNDISASKAETERDAAESAAVAKAEHAAALAFTQEIVERLGEEESLAPNLWADRLARTGRLVGLAAFYDETAVQALVLRVAAEAFRAGALAGADARRAQKVALQQEIEALLPKAEAAVRARWGRSFKSAVDCQVASWLGVSERTIRRARASR